MLRLTGSANNSGSLTGMAGEPVTTTTQMLLRVEARDVIGPMQRRHRVNGQPWSAWLPLQNGVSQLPVSGPAGALNYVADVEVRDAFAERVFQGNDRDAGLFMRQIP